MTREDIVALFASRQRAMDRHDVAAMSAMFAEDAVVESPTASGTVRGRTAIDEVTLAWFKGFPDVAWTTERLIIDGDVVAWITSTRGTDTGGFLGLPPTGKPFNLVMVTVSTLDDGRIVHERRIYDFTGMLVQIGVLKAKPA